MSVQTNITLKDLFTAEAPLITSTLIIFLIAFLVELFYYLYFFIQAGKEKPKKRVKKDSLPPVSVIICARNEEGNLKKNLPRILSQNYPYYEVIVVDDCSDDNTNTLLMDFKLKHPNFKFTAIKGDTKFTHNKKLALTIGIKAASNEHLLFTDADCYPASNRWIREMMINYTRKTEIVLGYGGYEMRSGFLNKIIRYETIFTAMQYMGFAERKIPYMGVGRNLSYTKSLFFKNKGFASHTHLDSGDDDLFISETANAINTVVETNPDSFTRSIPENNLKDWFRQRKRHFTTGFRYKPRIKLLLSLEYFARMFFYLSFLFLLFEVTLYQFILIIFVINLIIKGIILKIILRRLNEAFLFIFSLIIEPFIPFVYILIHFINFVESKKNRWR